MSQPSLTITLLGEPEVTSGQVPLGPFRTRKSLWLLALLVLAGGATADRRRLAAALWPETSDELARYNLRRQLADLRRVLGKESTRIQSQAGRLIRFDTAGVCVDALRFRELSARGDGGSLAEAVALYRGELLAGCREDWVYPLQEEFRSRYLAALAQLADHARLEQDHVAAVEYLRRAASVDPLRESTQQALLRALVQAGDGAAALAEYQQFRQRLWRELSVEPAAETLELSRDIRTKLRGPPPRSQRGAEALGPRRRELPRPATSFIGRAEECRQVRARLKQRRLMTLVGTAGIGKTRLAIRVAQLLADEVADGAAFVDLTALASQHAVADEIAAALGLRPVSGWPAIDVIANSLAERELLLVVDNCEHLLPAVAPLVAQLHARCRRLLILATSRQKLGIAGEELFSVGPLLLPDVDRISIRSQGTADSDSRADRRSDSAVPDSVRLFLDRAMEAQPALIDDEQTLEVAVRICRRLDGIPLALEMAAARAKSLPLAEVEARLDDRFALLTGGEQTAPRRHQTLRTALDWSYELLSAPQQTLLARLSVFAASFSLRAAEAICAVNPLAPGDVVDLLTALVDRSLVQFTPQGTDGFYSLLETVRQYGQEQLRRSGDLELMRRRHVDFFARIVDEARWHLFGGGRDPAWVERISQEYDNIRAACDACRELGSGEVLLAMVAGLHWFWFTRGLLDEGERHATWALAHAEQASGLIFARALTAAGFVSFWRGEYRMMLARHKQAFAAARRLCDRELQAYAQIGYGAALLFNKRAAAARKQLERGVAAARRHDDPTLLAFALFWLGHALQRLKRLRLADQRHRESLDISLAAKYLPGTAHNYQQLADVAAAAKDSAAAAKHLVNALVAMRQMGELWGISLVIENLACLASQRRDGPTAAEFLGVADMLRNTLGAGLAYHGEKRHEQTVKEATRQLGPAVYKSAFAAGKSLSIEVALERAIGWAQKAAVAGGERGPRTRRPARRRAAAGRMRVATSRKSG
jgi:predicted ATPase/DNA-binding SARP family transcriptional activator